MGRGELCLYGSSGYFMIWLLLLAMPRGNGHSELFQLLRLTKAIWAQPPQVRFAWYPPSNSDHTIALNFFLSFQSLYLTYIGKSSFFCDIKMLGFFFACFTFFIRPLNCLLQKKLGKPWKLQKKNCLVPLA